MNASSEDIKDLLVAESALALTFAENLFIGIEPTKPNNCVTIFDTVGGEPDLTLDQKSMFNPTIQIRVRNNGYVAGWTEIDAIANTLHSRAQEEVNGTLYSLISILSGPAMLHWDENKRVIFIVNLQIQRRPI